jgi:murein L,D-transpeptidase YcbB/YkuD
MQNDSTKTMRVCVGKSKVANYDEKYKEYLKTKNARAKPINTETPVIGSLIREVILNPTWTVPNSIIGKEMYHQIVSNPNYLTRKGFEVVLDGKVVSPNSISWKKYKPYGVPVKIRQKAGPTNSLGILKFNFPNGHNIYMHDTPEKGKFSQTNRAVSHGCVRLQYPLQMAEFLLNMQGDSSLVDNFRLKMGLQPYDSLRQIKDSLLKPIKTTEIIKLKNRIPVYLDYKTIVFENDGNIRFVKDIYRKNKAVAKKLKE